MYYMELTAISNPNTTYERSCVIYVVHEREKRLSKLVDGIIVT